MKKKSEKSDRKGGKRALPARIGLYLFVLLLPFGVFYWLTPFGTDLTIGNDYVVFPIQQQIELQYSLEHGSFPLYSPGFAEGRSSAALTLGQIYHPLPHLAALLPGYWEGRALDLNTFLRLLSLGLTHLCLLVVLIRLRLKIDIAFVISFITVYNLRMLDLFRYGSSLENYTGFLLLCAAMVFHYIKPTRVLGPALVIGATYLLVCGGHPQMMYLGLLGAGLACLSIPHAIAAIDPEVDVTMKRTLKFFGSVAICVAAGVLLASAYIVPYYFEFVRETAVRGGRGYKWSLAYCDTWGGQLNSFLKPMESVTMSVFGSTPVIVLAAMSPLIFAIRPRAPKVILFLWVAMVAIFFCSLGEATPVHYLFWKYFPLAQSFRVPGRITMILPVILLLILAWMFRPGEKALSLGKLKLPFSPYMVLALIGAALFIVYEFDLVKRIPEPTHYIPSRVNERPSWIDPVLFWTGLGSFVLLAVRGINFRWRTAGGIALCAAVVFQVTLEMRYGTWVVKKRTMPTLASMDEKKQNKLSFVGAPGYGMEAPIVSSQMSRSSLDPWLSRFFRKYKSATSQEQAYELMAKDHRADTLIVENHTPDGTETGDTSTQDVRRLDRVVLDKSSFNRLVFSVSTFAPGFVTLSFPFSGRWRALVDSSEAEVHRANGYENAVFVPAGEHTVEFRFWSAASVAGMVASCVTLLLIGVYTAFSFRSLKSRIAVSTVAVIVPSLVFLGWWDSLYSGDNLKTRYEWKSSQFPSPNNIAYGKRSKMSSIKSNQMPYFYYPGRGVDGDTSSRGFATSRGGRRPWWEVDLGREYALKEIVIYDGPNRWGRAYLPLIILLSNDGKRYRTALEIEDRGREKPWRIAVNGERARFVKLLSSRRGMMSFIEVEVYPVR